MKELSVAVVGGGRWAKALTVLLKHNQTKQRGHIRRVIEYTPPAAEAALPPPSLRVARRAQTDDATMMHMTADSLSALGADHDALADDPAGSAGSEDTTIMALTADAVAAVAASIAGRPPAPTLHADSEDATMMHMTADRVRATATATVTATATKDPSVGQAEAIKDVGSADLIFLTVPAETVRAVLRQIRGALRPQQMLVHCIGGFFPAEPESGQPAALISSIIRQETTLTRIGALAGPAQPEDLEEWNPAGLVCGSVTETVASATRQVLGCPTLRVYSNNDVAGVEVAAATASIVALGSGICDAQQLGLSVRAMLVARAAAELSRLGTQLGGSERTFLGLAGFGAFMLASENRDGADFQLGRLLGTGVTATKALTDLGRPVASLTTIRDAHGLAEEHGLRTPILTALYRMLFEHVAHGPTISALLADPNYAE